MDIIYLDIETIRDPGARQEIDAQHPLADFTAYEDIKVKPPSNYRSPEAIEKWMKANGEDKRQRDFQSGLAKYHKSLGEREGAWERAGLRAETGKVWCVAWAINDENIQCTHQGAQGDEETTLEQAFTRISERLQRGHHKQLPMRPMIVGHCSNKFDLPYLWRRAKMFGLDVPGWLPSPIQISPWSDRIIDTCMVWTGERNQYIGLEKLARLLDCAGKPPGGLSGDKIQDAVDRGHYELVAKYCMHDVATVRRVHWALCEPRWTQRIDEWDKETPF